MNMRHPACFRNNEVGRAKNVFSPRFQSILGDCIAFLLLPTRWRVSRSTSLVDGARFANGIFLAEFERFEEVDSFKFGFP